MVNLIKCIEEKNGTFESPRYSRGLVIAELVIAEFHCITKMRFMFLSHQNTKCLKTWMTYLDTSSVILVGKSMINLCIKIITVCRSTTEKKNNLLQNLSLSWKKKHIKSRDVRSCPKWVRLAPNGQSGTFSDQISVHAKMCWNLI